jgi:hypothetical protein
MTDLKLVCFSLIIISALFFVIMRLSYKAKFASNERLIKLIPSDQILDRYKFVHEEVRYLYSLMSSRMTWVATVQSFLVAAYAALFTFRDATFNRYIALCAVATLALLILIPASWIILINYKTLKNWVKLRFTIVFHHYDVLQGYSPIEEKDDCQEILSRRLAALKTRPFLIGIFLVFWIFALCFTQYVQQGVSTGL